jgi:hypothetical protein
MFSPIVYSPISEHSQPKKGVFGEYRRKIRYWRAYCWRNSRDSSKTISDVRHVLTKRFQPISTHLRAML